MEPVRPTRIEVTADAIRRNVARLLATCGHARLCAVVKADGYGHGIVESAVAAMEGGASMVGVALVEEAARLRATGFESPILVLSQPSADAWNAVVALDVECVLYTAIGIDGLAAAAAALGRSTRVHLKVDTGMNRVGCSPTAALDLAKRIDSSPHLTLAGLCTHLATADDPDSTFALEQVAAFADVDRALTSAGLGPYVRHVANSAATVLLPDAHFDMVRCGIACYGIAPDGGDPRDGLTQVEQRLDLDPALRFVSAVSLVKRVPAGATMSYGRRYTSQKSSTIATIPVGYADGLDRRYGVVGGEVLIGGRRHRVAGTVTMDQVMVDVGDWPVEVGDEVVVIGAQGDEEITANEVAWRLGTIGYEVVARLGVRVPRVELG